MNMEKLKREVEVKTSRSGGAGGQHVNKVETKVTLFWKVADSQLFSTVDKSTIESKLKNRINDDGYLVVDSSETRSQLDNKHRAFEKLKNLLIEALVPEKERKATKIPRSKILERLDRKKRQGQKKSDRRWRME